MNIVRRIARIEEQLSCDQAWHDCRDVVEIKRLTFMDLALIAEGKKLAGCSTCGRQFYRDNCWVGELAATTV